MAAQLKVYGYNFLEEILPDSLVEEFRNSLEGFILRRPASAGMTVPQWRSYTLEQR